MTVLEVINDNMPFLLDSTLAEIVDQGYEPILVAHPILAVERDEGALRRLLGEATAGTQGEVKRESFIHIHLDRIDEPSARERLARAFAASTRMLAVAVGDWPGMRARVAAAIESYRANPPPLPADEVAEALAFLEWMAEDNFTFLGLREYRLPAGGTAADPVVDRASAAARCRHAGPSPRQGTGGHVAGGARLPGAAPRLIIAKANVKSRVHRRAHLDYVGVKLFAGDGALEGELRIVGLFTASAYTNTTAEVPYLHKVAQVVSRAGFDPASYAGRALLNVLENYPRDELFQVDDDTLYRFALEILNLSERPRIRVLARPTSSTASSRSWCSFRRTATTARSAAGSASSLRASMADACRPPIRPIRRSAGADPLRHRARWRRDAQDRPRHA